MSARNGTVSLVELAMLLAAVVVATVLGGSLQRALWEATEVPRYRAVALELASTVRAMPGRAQAQRRTLQLQIDATRGVFELASIAGKPHSYKTVERVIWLPRGLQISEAPETVTARPSGWLSSGTIVIAAPSCNRLFRINADERGRVRLDEEHTS